MKKSELAKELMVPEEELAEAYVNSFNRKVLTDLADAEFSGDVADKDVETAKNLLIDFLKEMWPEKPQAHKYVINSCLTLAFLFEKPLHPKESANYTVRVENGKERYFCSYNEPGTICDFCAAEPAENL